MKTLISLFIAASLLSGCATTGLTHEDSPAAVKRDEGPSLCLDGTIPPCVSRD